jgi:hypothetical protein
MGALERWKMTRHRYYRCDKNAKSGTKKLSFSIDRIPAPKAEAGGVV